MKDKRGQGLSVNAIILIVIGVIVLVILVLGFTIGWNRLLPFVASNNVQTIKTACTLACSTGNTFDFCEVQRTLKADDSGLTDGEAKGTCFIFSDPSGLYVRFGIKTCSSITSCP